MAQVLAPAPEYCPAAQFTQAKNMPEILECLPEAQLWHAVLASPSLSYCPAAQLEHTVPPACAESIRGVSTRILGKTMRDAVRNKKGW